MAEELSSKKFDDAKKSVSTAYIVLTIISSFMLIALLLITFMVNWGNIFNTKVDMQITVGISFFFICVNFVLALSNVLLYALQMSEKVSFRNVIAQCVNIVGLLILNSFSSGNLVYMAILFGISTSIIYIATSIQLFKKHKYLKPNVKYYAKSKLSNICSVGLKFFVIQIVCLVMYSTSNFIIASLYGASAVTPYSMVDKIFNAANGIWTAFLIPYWSRATVATANNDMDWIKRTVKRLMILNGVFVIGYIILAIIFKPLAEIWLRHKLDYENGLIATVCIYYIALNFNSIFSNILNGMGKKFETS